MPGDELGIRAIEQVAHTDLDAEAPPLRETADVREAIRADHLAGLIERRVRANPVAGKLHTPPTPRWRKLEGSRSDVPRGIVDTKTVEHGGWLVAALRFRREMAVTGVEKCPV